MGRKKIHTNTKRITISIDQTEAEALERIDHNASAAVRKLLRNYLAQIELEPEPEPALPDPEKFPY